MDSLYDSLPSLLAATVAFAIGASVVLRDRSRDELALFGVFCFNLGLFHLARFFHGFSGIAIFDWLAQTVSLVLPWSADRCFASIVPTEHSRGGRRFEVVRGVALATLLIAQAITFFVFVGAASTTALGDRVWWWVSRALDAYVIFGLLLVIRRLLRAAHAAEGTAKAPRLRYLGWASVLALAFGSPLLPAVGPVVTAVYLYFVAQTLQRERLLELPELVAKIVTLSLLVVLVSGVYAALVLWIPAVGGNSTALFLFNIAVSSYAVIVLIDPIRTEVELRVESWLFRDREAMRRLLLDLRDQLLNVLHPDELVDAVIGALTTSQRVTRASVYLLDITGDALTLRGQLGEGPAPRRLDLATRRPLVDALVRDGAILRDVIQRERERAGTDRRAELEEVHAILTELGASLVVAVFEPSRAFRERDEGAREVIALICVDDERLLEPFSLEEVDLFQRVAAQAGITLQNSAAYERRKERDRLAVLGEMSAGLAHEIRNPLGAIKGAVQLLQPRLAQGDASSRDLFAVIEEEVHRLDRVVREFLGYARPFTGDLVRAEPAAIVAATLRLLSDARGGIVTADASEGLPAVRADADAIRQVLHNLVLNALDALEGAPPDPSAPPPRVWVEARLRPRGLPSGDAVALIVRDNGPGLSAAAMANLFVPFHTTKSGGTGLGLPISQRIVENHHGVLEVGNTSGGGACFAVVLPVFVASPESQAHLSRRAVDATARAGQPTAPLAPSDAAK